MSDQENHTEMPQSPGPYGLLHLGRGNFGEALRALKDGQMVCRSGWNGKGMFVFMQVPAEIPIATVVPNMQSLPDLVKAEFISRNKSEQEILKGTKHLLKNPPILLAENIKYSNQMAIVDKENNINGWAPSSSDALANDWSVYYGN